MNKLILTFDIEDFVNSNAIIALRTIVEILNKYQLRSILFITGHMAEKLSNYPELLDLLKNHEIGFHSSSHSVRPTIPEYTDLENYNDAYSISLERETAHINPLTGEINGEGGIYFLQDLFHPKKIEAFRAPGMSWNPPHLEALVDLGIKFDFSANITTSIPVHYKGVTFYPYTFTQQWEGVRLDYQSLLSAILRRKVSVFDCHPTLYVNHNMWDYSYYNGNPQTLIRAHERTLKEARLLFRKFELLLKQITFLQRARLIEVDVKFNTKPRDLIISKNEVQNYYETSVRWPIKYFNYIPIFTRTHFYEFFKAACC